MKRGFTLVMSHCDTVMSPELALTENFCLQVKINLLILIEKGRTTRPANVLKLS